MFHYFNAIQNTRGDALIGYYVRVVDSGGNGVPLYADSNSTPIVAVSGLADAARVNSDGEADFYVSIGTYRLDIYATDGSTLIKSIADVPMNIDEDTAALAAAAQASATASATAAANSETNALVSKNAAAASATLAVASASTATSAEAGVLTALGGSSLSTVNLAAGTRTALAALNHALGVPATFDGSLWEFNSADLSAQVTADTQQGLYVPPTGHNGSTGAWVRKFSGPADFRWFGAVADCTVVGSGTSNTAVFDAARTALIAAGLGWLHMPQRPAAYRFATAPAEIHDKIMITGEGWSNNPGIVGVTTYVGIQAYNGTVLAFDADVAGLLFVGFTDNLANATADEFQSATGSVVRDLMLYSAGGTGITSHGIERRTAVHLDNVRIEGFAGYGLKTSGYSSGANPWGSVDCTYARAVSCRFNKLSGFYTTGDDANVNHFDTCDSALNGGVGYLDKGLLGNTYTNSHAATNNASYGTPAGYSAAQRTQNTTDWSGLSDQLAGSYVTTSGVAAHKFDGCYAETGQGQKHQIIYPAIVSSGSLASVTWVSTGSSGDQPAVWNSSLLSGIDTITSQGGLALTVGENLTVNPASGNATIVAKGAGAFSLLHLYPSNSSANGLEILAGSGLAQYSSDAHYYKNAAQTVTFASVSSAGILAGVPIGYATGAGGTVTQATSKSTGVSLNKVSGQITMNAAALAAGAKVSFVVTNSTVAATDIIVVNVVSGGTANAYRAAVTAVAAGSFTATVENITAGSLSEAPVIGFANFKAVAA